MLLAGDLRMIQSALHIFGRTRKPVNMRLQRLAAAGLFSIVVSVFSGGQSAALPAILILLGQDCRPTGGGAPHSPPVPVEQGGKWGYADSDGILLIRPQFEKARKFSGGLAAVYVRTGAAPKVGGGGSSGDTPAKWGFIDKTGNIVITPEFEEVADFSEGLAAVSYKVPSIDTNTWGYIDSQGHVVIEPQFSTADPFAEGLALVWAGGVSLTDPVVKSFVKMGYIDKTGKWVIGSRFTYFFYNSFSEGLVPFRKNGGKWGYMNKKGKVVIKPQFDWAGDFSQGSALVLNVGVCAHVDKAGQVMVQSSQQSPNMGQKRRPEQDRHGTYTFPPTGPPCS
jgi:hypothetical protein